MKRPFPRAVIILLLLVIASCAKAPERKGGIGVAVSVFPIYDIARSVAGDRARVYSAIPPGADPHTYEPRPSTARELGNSSLFIGVTPEFDGWIERYLPRDAARRYLMEGDGAGHGNPHIWLSVRKAKGIAAAIAAALEERDPANGGHYRRNLAAYTRRLDDLDASIAALFAGARERTFIQWHEAWNYFASDYGLTVLDTVHGEGSERASVRSIGAIVREARRRGVTVIVMSERVDDRGARVLAKEIGGKVVRLDGIGGPDAPGRSDYIQLMTHNATALAGALR